MEEIITKALKNSQKALSEYESKKILKTAGIPVTREDLVLSKNEAIEIAGKIGYPVVLKGSGHKVIHKTEMGIVKLGIASDQELVKAYDEIMNKGVELDGVLVQEMINGDREFIIGLSRDPQFGHYVMFGLGGIYAEALKDVAFRIAPISWLDAEEMMSELKTSRLLNEFRGKPAVDRSILTNTLIRVGNLGLENNEIAEIDINPLIISDGKPVAVDSLIILS